MCERCLQVDYYSLDTCRGIVCLNILWFISHIKGFGSKHRSHAQHSWPVMAQISYKWVSVWQTFSSICVSRFGQYVLRIHLEIPPTGVSREISDSHLYQDPEIGNRNVLLFIRKQVLVKYPVSAKNFSLESLCSALLLQLLRRGDDRKQQLCLRTVVRPLTFHPLWLAAVLEMLESAVWFYEQVFLPSLLHNM